MKVKIANLRIAFPALFEAQAYDDGKPKFGAKFIVPPDHPAVKQLDDAMRATARDKWGEKADKIFDNFVKTGKKPEVAFVREPYKNREGDAYDGFDGMFYLSASNDSRPLILDRDKTPLVAADGRPYAGSYVNVSIELWAQDNKWGRAIRATLSGVQFVKDGDAFAGGAPASPDDFEDLSEGAREEALA